MSLSLQDQAVSNLVKKATFEQLTINQDKDGKITVDGRYKIELLDENGNLVTTLDSVSFGMNQDQLVANPNFATAYPIIRDLARSGLALVKPEFVAQL